METYWINPQWTDELAQEKLDNLVLLLMYTEGKCLSMHSRGSTFRCTLPHGQTVFVKRDHYTMFKDILAQLFHGERPAAKSIREWRVLQHLTKLGFTVPQVIAAGKRTHLGLPSVAGIVMLPLPGTSLVDYLKQDRTTEEKRQAIGLALRELEKLQDAGVDWPDCKPEHFFLMENKQIGLLDLERVIFRGGALGEKLRIQLRERFRRSLPKDCRPLMPEA